jgi:hypothetical protein
MLNFDQPISGFITIGINPIEQLNISQIYRPFSESSSSLDFFSRIIGRSSFGTDIDIKRYSRASKIASMYVQYTIQYSLHPPEEIIDFLQGSFTTILLFHSSNLLFELCKIKERFFSNSRFQGCCKIKDMKLLLEGYECLQFGSSYN